MFEFTIVFYDSKYHTGELNYNSTSTATVYAETYSEAAEKIKSTGLSFYGAKNITVKELLVHESTFAV